MLNCRFRKSFIVKKTENFSKTILEIVQVVFGAAPDPSVR